MAGGVCSMVGGWVGGWVGGSFLNATIKRDFYSVINVSGNCNGRAIYINTAAVISLIVIANQVFIVFAVVIFF
jgi:hypothetical protein